MMPVTSKPPESVKSRGDQTHNTKFVAKARVDYLRARWLWRWWWGRWCRWQFVHRLSSQPLGSLPRTGSKWRSLFLSKSHLRPQQRVAKSPCGPDCRSGPRTRTFVRKGNAWTDLPDNYKQRGESLDCYETLTHQKSRYFQCIMHRLCLTSQCKTEIERNFRLVVLTAKLPSRLQIHRDLESHRSLAVVSAVKINEVDWCVRDGLRTYRRFGMAVQVGATPRLDTKLRRGKRYLVWRSNASLRRESRTFINRRNVTDLRSWQSAHLPVIWNWNTNSHSNVTGTSVTHLHLLIELWAGSSDATRFGFDQFHGPFFKRYRSQRFDVEGRSAVRVHCHAHNR